MLKTPVLVACFPCDIEAMRFARFFRAAMKPMRLKAAFGDTDPTPNGPTLDHADSFINLSSTRLPR
jgi:hypothetical protein